MMLLFLIQCHLNIFGFASADSSEGIRKRSGTVGVSADHGGAHKDIHSAGVTDELTRTQYPVSEDQLLSSAPSGSSPKLRDGEVTYDPNKPWDFVFLG